MKVVIYRGVPGSGKSTDIKNNYPNAVVCSADDYFMHNGKYLYEPTLIGEAHKSCMRKFLDAITELRPLIVVDNTNIRYAELSPYAAVAQAKRYDVEIRRMAIGSRGDAEVAANRNVHNVPRHTVMNMAKAFENLPRYLTEIVVG